MKRTGGFTLIELMVVVGLMILVGSIVVSGSFGMTRASGYTAAQDLVYNTLQMARQKACTDGKRVIIAFVAPPKVKTYEDNSFTAIEATGTITESVGGGYIQDRCANLAKYTESGKESTGSSTNTVWNLRTGAKFNGFKLTVNDQVGGSKTTPIPGANGSFYQYYVTRITPTSGSGFEKANWRKGDPYGFQIVPVQLLPKGMKIGFGGVGTSPEGKLIVFEPDGTGFYGTASKNGISKTSANAELYLYEEINAKDQKKAIRIKISNGILSVE